MATFGQKQVGAVLVHGPVSPAFYARAPELGLVARKTPLPTANLWIKSLGTTSEETLTTAIQISRTVEGRVLGVYGRDDLDVYVVAEARSGQLVRRVRYVRDDGGWKVSGDPQPWESDFHFALPLDQFMAGLEGSGWTTRDAEAARNAHRAHDLSLLPRRPSPRMNQLILFVENLGFDWDGGPHVEWKPPGFLGRLLGI